MLPPLLCGSTLAWGRTKALPHVNDLHVHLVACVRVIGHVLDVLFIYSMHPGAVLGDLVLLALTLHVLVVGVDDGRGEVNQGVLLVLCATLNLVVGMDVDKLLAVQASNLEHF